ncbi:p1 protein [Hemisteptia virus A]|nr:p1 protein [Hemisteptia virus A]
MKFLFALFCFALLSFSFGEELIYMGSKYEPVDSQRSNLYGGPLKLDTTYNLTSLDLHYQWILVSQEPRKVLEMPYAELAHIFYMKISHDISENAQRQWKYASEVSNSLGISYSHLCEVSWKLIEFTATGILAMGTFLAYFSTLTFIAIVTSLLTKHTFAFIFLVSWMYSVTYLYNFLKSRFGISLKFLILFPRLFLKSIAIVISKALISSSGKDFKEEYEMAVKGFITHDFIQEPPKKSILEMVFDDNSHGGYAVCARMADGKDYLLTVAHNVIDPRTGKKYDRKIKIRSTYTGHAIDLGLFTRIHINQETDFAMFEGPQNWESILGCKGARYLTASSLRLGEVSIYHLKGEPARWNRSGGKTVEALENYKVKVLSHTTEGYSGSPYWSGKDIVGLHSAARENANCNVMATIPDVSGLTTSNYVFETTALRGKVFDDVPKVTPEYFYSYKRTAEKLKGKMTWADEVDELEKNSSNDRFECKQYQQLETCFSGLYDDGTKSFIEWCNEVKDRRNGTLPPFNNELDNELAFQWRNSDIDLALARHENLRLKEALEKAKLEKEEPNRVDHNKYETAIPLNGERGTDRTTTGDESLSGAEKPTNGVMDSGEPTAPIPSAPLYPEVDQSGVNMNPTGCPTISDTLGQILLEIAAKIDQLSDRSSKLEEIVNKPQSLKRNGRGKRGGKSKPKGSENSSPPSTSGTKYVPPPRKPQASGESVKPPPSTGQKGKWIPNGPPTLSTNTQNSKRW